MEEWKYLSVSSGGSFGFYSAAMLGDDIYFISSSSMLIYNTISNSWRNGAGPFPSRTEEGLRQGTSWHSAVVVGNTIYVVGGWTSSNTHSGPVYQYRSEVHRYIPATNKWAVVGNTLAPIAFTAVATDGQRIYICGGRGGGDALVNTIQVFDTQNNSIRNLGVSLDAPTFQASAEIIGDNLYVMGGLTPSNTSNTYVINLTTHSKRQTQPKTFAGKTCSAKRLNMIYAASVGGVEMFNTTTQTWSILAALPGSRSLKDAVLVKNGILYLGRNVEVKLQQYEVMVHSMDIVQAKIANPTPAGGFVNEQIPQTFSWDLITKPEGVPQSEATVEWRGKNAATSVAIPVAGPTQSITFPAYTFPDGVMEWRVKATAQNGQETDWTGWMELTTVDLPPFAPVNLSPNGGQEDGTKQITFYWTHRSPLSTAQTGFDLEITYEANLPNPAWTVLGSENIKDSSFTAPENTLVPTDPGGVIGWRVRTYNSDNTPGPYSQPAWFVVHPAPQTPVIIRVETGKNRPLICWQSMHQIAWELEIRSFATVIYGTGQVFGEDKSHSVASTRDAYLPNGAYTVYLRIQNICGLWSDWGVYTANINTQKHMKILLSGTGALNSGRLEWKGYLDSGQEWRISDAQGQPWTQLNPHGYPWKAEVTDDQEGLETTAHYYVLRDDIPVAKVVKSKQWVDYMATGVHRYKIRAVDRQDNYTDSNEVILTVDIAGCTLALASNPGAYLSLNMRRGSKPSLGGSVGVLYTEERYEGREYPVYHKTTQREAWETASFSTGSTQELHALERLVLAGENLIYRDLRGRRVVGVIRNLPVEYADKNPEARHSHVEDFTFTIHQSDYQERVPYD